MRNGDGPEGDGRADDLPAAAGEFGGGDSTEFRVFATDVSADSGAVFAEQVPAFSKFANVIKWGEPLYTLIYVTLIIFFAFSTRALFFI